MNGELKIMNNQDVLKFNIADYGAVPSDFLQTELIQKVIDDCFLKGGGEVIIPAGIYRVGGLRLRSNVILHLLSGAVLEGSKNPEDYMSYMNDSIEPIDLSQEEDNEFRSVYPFSRWNNAIIRIFNSENVSIIGDEGSYIDGVNCYDAEGEENFRGPHAIDVYKCNGLKLSGYSIRNSANWAHNIMRSQNIVVQEVSVYGGHDGFDVRSCDNILVENCKFYTGDDCIAGFDNTDVTIRNCKFNSACSVLRFGGTNVHVKDCELKTPASFGFRGSLNAEQKALGVPTDKNCRTNTITAFLYYCDFRAEIRETPGNILIEDCVFDGVDCLFSLPFSGEQRWCCNRSLNSIEFKNCKANNVCRPINIAGDENEPLSLKLDNIEISAREGFEDIPLINAKNFEKIELCNVLHKGFKCAAVNKLTDGSVEVSNTENIEIKNR